VLLELPQESVFLRTFHIQGQAKQGGSHVRAALDVGLLFIVLLLWIVDASNALYGLGYVIDEPPEILGVAQMSTKSSNQALQPTAQMALFFFMSSVPSVPTGAATCAPLSRG
jgi:hypothetical protein